MVCTQWNRTIFTAWTAGLAFMLAACGGQDVEPDAARMPEELLAATPAGGLPDDVPIDANWTGVEVEALNDGTAFAVDASSAGPLELLEQRYTQMAEELDWSLHASSTDDGAGLRVLSFVKGDRALNLTLMEDGEAVSVALQTGALPQNR